MKRASHSPRDTRRQDFPPLERRRRMKVGDLADHQATVKQRRLDIKDDALDEPRRPLFDPDHLAHPAGAVRCRTAVERLQDVGAVMSVQKLFHVMPLDAAAERPVESRASEAHQKSLIRFNRQDEEMRQESVVDLGGINELTSPARCEIIGNASQGWRHVGAGIISIPRHAGLGKADGDRRAVFWGAVDVEVAAMQLHQRQ